MLFHAHGSHARRPASSLSGSHTYQACTLDRPVKSAARESGVSSQCLPVQGKAWWHRPQMIALIALALLGSAGLASTWSGPLRRNTLGKHNHLMAQGVPESLMHVNITAAYVEGFCGTSVASNLTTQQWTDGPMCQRGGAGLKVHHLPFRMSCSVQTHANE